MGRVTTRHERRQARKALARTWTWLGICVEHRLLGTQKKVGPSGKQSLRVPDDAITRSIGESIRSLRHVLILGAPTPEKVAAVRKADEEARAAAERGAVAKAADLAKSAIQKAARKLWTPRG